MVIIRARSLPPLLLLSVQVLRDPSSRALHDYQLSQQQLRHTVVLQDEIRLADMDVTDPGATQGGGGGGGGCEQQGGQGGYG